MPQNLLRGYLHFVWATYDRLPLITEEIERDVHRYITTVCENDKCKYNQKQHHADSTLWPEAEQTFDEGSADA